MEKCELQNVVCRACLTEDGEFQSVFIKQDSSGISLFLSEMMSACACIQQVTLGDGLPDQICCECAGNIVNMYLFKLKCEKSESFLRESLCKATAICKIEKNHLEESGKDPVKPELVEDKEINQPQSEEIEFVDKFDSLPYKTEILEDIPEILNITSTHETAFKQEIELDLTSEEFMFDCLPCGISFTKKEDLDNHIALQHETKVEHVFICNKCSRRFSKFANLNEHLKSHKNVRSLLKRHICGFCLVGFSQLSNLKDHMRVHNGEKPFVCSTCDKSFSQIANLKQHINRHEGIKTYVCSTCGIGFISKGELSAHQRKHTGARPFVCQVCDHGFSTSSSLTKHKRIHSGEKPYECDVCKRKFSRSGILARHKRTHTGEKPYACEICGKAFAQSNDLKSHRRIHTGEKPYICDHCGLAFRQSSALKTHKKTYHEQIMICEDIKPIVLD